ncbi:MAG: hypothetical protein MZV64_44690 [Ignavibacteriales bacterium]|nr:hypothetical protein [Ignavibacteriales bacterium]
MIVDRRGHLHGAPAAGDAALLPPRVLRPVHAVPRGHGLDAPDHRPHRRRRGPRRRTSTQLIAHLATPTTAPRSAAWATPPATPRSASSPSTATSSSTASSTSARSATAARSRRRHA